VGARIISVLLICVQKALSGRKRAAAIQKAIYSPKNRAYNRSGGNSRPQDEFMRIIGMEKDTEQRSKSRCNYILAAWASLCAGVVNFAAFAWIINHPDGSMRNGRGTVVFLVFLLTSAAGGFAGVRSLFGIRSWWNALFIIPGALFGILINGWMGLACFALLCGVVPM